ncbi:MAG: DUF4982 domain-containing protein [Clostridia bacterium]|nr:DUF4982 domain-containing protein [Clostridia bacterium]
MKRMNFNRDWSFRLNDGESQIVHLPHDFSINQERSENAPSGGAGGFFPGGYGVYEKSFVSKKGKKYFFMCDGSFGITEVLINYNLVHINKYGYNSFYAELTEYLRYDRDNILTVRVNNKWQPNARWYTGSGMYRDAFLCVADSSYLDPYGPFAYTENVIGSTAYMSAEISFYSSSRGEGVLKFDIYEDGRRSPVHSFERRVYAIEGKNSIGTRFQLENAKLWSIDNPNIYRMKVTLILNGSKDSDEAVFGVRTIVADCRRGLLLNGQSVKLHGGCIHHDHGMIGSAAFPDAEYRRIALLKKAGFNAVRLSHNPQSQHLYDACDRLGMLVIDELFDYWTDGKQKDDMHAFFDDNYIKWTEQIILRNRQHPSIIMWSTGNEIPQKSGRGYGYEIARNIANKIRSLDTSRPLIHCFCSLWDNKEEFEMENATKDLSADVMDYYAQRIAITADTVDVIGYNYMEYRLDRDLIRFPDKLFVNTETFPLSAFTTYNQLKDNPRILGDFVWTAWDYFGETGIGHINYHYPETDDLLADRHPNHISNCGDFNICGRRKPQSYLREIAWGVRKDPYIACAHPKSLLRPYSPNGWGFYECEHSWCFDGYEGKEAGIYVFADCDFLTVSVNGIEIGRAERVENGIYFFKAEYQPGQVVATSWKNGKIAGSSSIRTEGVADKLVISKEPSYLARSTARPESHLIYLNVSIVDKNGLLCSCDNRLVKFKTEGAKILGVGSGHLTDLTRYTDTEWHLFRGQLTVVLKIDKDAEAVTLTAEADGLPSVVWKK